MPFKDCFDIKDKMTILLTRKCNAFCSHCGINSSPFVDEVIEHKTISKAIEGAHTLGMQRITITGGEPTLYLEKLHHVCTTANEYGMRISFVTNGWWGKSSAAKRILNLVKTYCYSMCVSIDDYHTPYIPIKDSFAAVIGALNTINSCDVISINSDSNESIKLLFQTLSEFFGRPTNIEKNFTDNPAKPDRLTVKFGNKILRVRYSGVGPVGRGTTFAIDRFNTYETVAPGCTTEICVGCSGEVKPCCASLGEGFNHLVMGNLDEHSIMDLIELYPQFESINPLEAVKIYYQKHISCELPPLVNSCELCYLLGKKHNISSLKEIYNEVEG